MNQSNQAEILSFVSQLEICDFESVSDRVSPVCLMIIENKSVSVRENLKPRKDRDSPEGFYVRVPRIADILTAVYSPVGFKRIMIIVNDKVIHEAVDMPRGWVRGFAAHLGTYAKCEIKFTPPEYPNFSAECFAGISDIIFTSLTAEVVFLEPEERMRLFTLMGEPKMGDLKMSETETDEPKMGEPKMGEPKMGEPKMGDLKMSEPKMGEFKMSDFKMGEPETRPF